MEAPINVGTIWGVGEGKGMEREEERKSLITLAISANMICIDAINGSF